MLNREFLSQTPAAGTARWLSSTPNLLVYTPYAAKRQLDMIGWLRTDFPDNRNEQGGWLIGRYVRDSSGHPVQAEVTEVLQATANCRSPGYIEWDAQEENRLQMQFFDMKDALAATDPVQAKELSVLGWWHTHPNGLPVFMSGTDMETQRLKYFKPEKYAVVLNPHRGLWRAFSGADAVEVPAVMLLEDTRVPDVPAKANSDDVPITHSIFFFSRKKKKKAKDKRKKKRR